MREERESDRVVRSLLLLPLQKEYGMKGSVMAAGTSRVAAALDRVAAALDRIGPVVRIANIIGVVILFVMIVVTFVDVVLRYFFRRPLPASIEIVQIMMVVLVFFAVAYTYQAGGHVSLDLLVGRLSSRVRATVSAVIRVLALFTFSVIIWQTVVYALHLQHVGSRMAVLKIPWFPWPFVVVLGCTLLCVLLARDLFRNLAEAIRSRLGLLTGGIVLLVVVAVATVGMTQLSLLRELGPINIAILGVAVLVLFLLSGMPVAFALALVAFIGLAQVDSVRTALSIAGQEMFRTSFDYSWAAIPFFVTMGYFVMYSGIGSDLYTAGYKLVGSLPGGLAIATTGACAVFGACVGDTMTGIITMTPVALPEMQRFKYSPRLITGSIASSSTLGALIPPSIGFLFYGLLTQTSIGKLFIAGIFPGILLAGMFAVLIYVHCRIVPEYGPAGPRTSFIEKVTSLKTVWPVLILFMLVIGGLYMGLCSPTEAGAVGAGGALIIGLCMRRMTWQKVLAALLEAGKLSAMIMLLLGGANMFGYFLALSKFGPTAITMVTGLNVPPIAILGFFIAILFICGCFMPYFATLVVTLPLAFPILAGLGFDPIYIGVIVVVLLNIAVLTPPFCINLWIMKAVSDIPMETIIRGTFPFIIVTVVCLVIIVFCPQIATFLPYLLK